MDHYFYLIAEAEEFKLYNPLEQSYHESYIFNFYGHVSQCALSKYRKRYLRLLLRNKMEPLWERELCRCMVVHLPPSEFHSTCLPYCKYNVSTRVNL